MRLGVRDGRIVTTLPAGPSARRRRRPTREDAHYVYRRTGQPCRRCGTPIRTALMAGRNLLLVPALPAGLKSESAKPISREVEIVSAAGVDPDMSLTLGTGPLNRRRPGTFNFDIDASSPQHIIYIEDVPQRIRAVFNGETVVDTRAARRCSTRATSLASGTSPPRTSATIC